MRYLITLLLCMGCATSTAKTYRFPNVHPELIPLVIKFDYHYYKYYKKLVPDNIVVKLDIIKESEKAGGLYHRIRNETTISLRHWAFISEAEKENVVFHELGHHVLNLNHDWSKKRIMKDKCPKSIMFYRSIGTRCYKKNRKHYLKELFKRGKKKHEKFRKLCMHRW